MSKNNKRSRIYTVSTTLTEEEFELFEEARLRSGGKTSETVRRYILSEAGALNTSSDTVERKPEVEMTSVNFRVPSEVYSRFKAWCKGQKPSWYYGHAITEAME